MKFDELRSIGHNIAHSLASGVGLPIGLYFTDIFGEAGRSPEGSITVDFLAGKCVKGSPSPSLSRAVELYKDVLADLCKKHGISNSPFKELTARYSPDICGGRFLVAIEDQAGRRSADEYLAPEGSRPKVLDHLGRARPK